MAIYQSVTITQVSYDYATNTSQVRIQWTSQQTGSSYNEGTNKPLPEGYMDVQIGGAYTDGEPQYMPYDVRLPYQTTVTLVDVTFSAQHAADGRLFISASTYMDTKISAGVVEVYEEATFNMPRESTISSALDRNLGEACSVSWTPQSKDFTYKLSFSAGNIILGTSWSDETEIIRPNTTSAYTYTGYILPFDITNISGFTGKTHPVNVTLTTYLDYDGKVQVGSRSSKTFKVTVPENNETKPTVSMSLTPLSDLKSPYNSLYLQGYSKVKATLDYSAKYGATISSSNITVNGITYPSPYESGILSQAGTISVTATVKDSRGHYGTNHQDIEVIPYRKPFVQAYSGESGIIAARCDADGNFTDSGTYLKIKAKVAFSRVISNGVQYNYGNIKYRYRKEGGDYSDWNTILSGETDNSDEVITPPLENGTLDITSNYQVQIVAFDDLYESDQITVAVPSDSVYMHRPAGGKSMGLGGYTSGDGNLDIFWKTKARGGLSLFDSKGDEIPLDSTLPHPRGQVNADWDPDNLENGAYVVTSSKPLKSGDTVFMDNGVLIQINGTVDGSVKMQLALTSDENENPFYRAYWDGNWGNWRSFKL